MRRSGEDAEVTVAPKNKLSPHRQALYDAAHKQRMLCCDWLIYIMASSSVKTRTKSVG
jgi:hypothetical protein